MAEAPIADLTYRGYTGALTPASSRWKVIARMGLRQALGKKSFWVMSLLAGWYYYALIVIVYFVEQIAQATMPGGPGADRFLGDLQWHAEFVTGFSFGQLFYLVLALLVGAGSIANDNRSHALLVYLSKPCTKRDYLVGKWVGVWAALTIAMAIPTLFFFVYGALNYRAYGFLDDPWMVVRVLLLCPLAATFHASLVVGISSLFNQGRMAGAAYAGLYFLTLMFTKLMQVLWMLGNSTRYDGPEIGVPLTLVRHLFYASVDGVLIALAKVVMNTSGDPPFGIPPDVPVVPALPAWMVLGVMALASAGMLALAWVRVKAVEVVR